MTRIGDEVIDDGVAGDEGGGDDGGDEDGAAVAATGPAARPRRSRTRRRHYLAALVALFVVGVVAGVLASSSPPVPLHYSFVDNFEGPAGASPNFGLPQPYWFNDPCWTTGCGTPPIPTRNSWANAYLNGHGQLVLEADDRASGQCGPVACRYTSARLTMIDWQPHAATASFAQQYGTFSARIKAPVGAGLWPAFWLEGANDASVGWPASGEIDAFESFGRPGIVAQHIEYGTSAVVGRLGDDWALASGQSLSGWHTYTVVWSPTGITWQVDGVTTYSVSAADVGSSWARAFEHPYTIILDLAVGGAAGSPSAATAFPAKMLVDWVKVATND